MNQLDLYREKINTCKCCILVPTYNNDLKIAAVLNGILQYTNQVIVVNDGSTDSTDQILDTYTDINVISYTTNKGKGWALRIGFEAALNLGFDYVITIDSDGQHRPEDIPLFIDLIEKKPNVLIVGSRNMSQDGVPGTSNFGHRFSNFWYKLETGIDLPDTQSGYRLYPLKAIEGMRYYTTKYEFELEVLVRVAWKGIEVIPIPINVIYPEDRITHFRLFKDFARISVLNTFFVIWTFIYVKPVKFLSNFKKENRKAFIQKHFLMSEDSNIRITLAVMLGFFIGVAPIWGYQIIAGLALAHLFKFSKVLVVTASHISIPPMIPFILFLSIRLGGFIMDNPDPILYNAEINFETIKESAFQYVVGSLALATLLAICSGVITYILLSLFRNKPMVTN